jgi:uncharacterized membrane protein YgcG
VSEEEPTQPEAPARAAGSTASAARGLFRRDMERQEQLMSFAAAALAVVLGVVGALTYKAPAHNAAHNAAHAAKTVSPDLLLGLACGFGVALWLAARHGSRVLTALVAMALFLTAFSGTILGFPFVGLGGWLLIKNSRAVREQRQAARGQGSGSGRSGGSSRSSTGAGAAGGRASTRPPRETRQARRARKDAEAEAARRIEANKRYTPPAPRRRRPSR